MALDSLGDNESRQASELRALHEAALAIGGAQDLSTRLERVLDAALQLGGTDQALVALVNADAQVIEVAAARGTLVVPMGSRQPLGSGLTGQVLLHNRPVRTADQSADSRTWRPERKGEARSWLGVPLSDAGGAFGALAVVSLEPNVFTDDHERRLLSLAALASSAIRESRLLEREQRARISAEALADSRALYEAAAVNLVDGLVLIDCDNRVLFFNPRMERLFGVRSADVVGTSIVDLTRSFYDLTEDPNGTMLRARAASEAAMAGRPTAFEYRINSAPPRDLVTLIFPIMGPQGPLGQGRLVRDVTAERASERVKDEFVALVSHELRTPLTSIKGYLHLLQDGALGAIPPDQGEFLEVILRNATRLEALVDDLLDLSRLEAGGLELRREPVELGALIRQAAEALRPELARKEQTLAVEIDSDLPVVWGDQRRLSQVFGNLLSNASKYTPDRGGIAVLARPDDGWVRIDVQDNGVGLTPDEQARMFTKFYRAENRATQEASGTGLGLAITRSLVEAHGGKIVVESEPGVGSTFSVRLPLRREKRSAQP